MAPPKHSEKPKASPLKQGYLILYNFASAVAWLTVLGRVAAVASTRGTDFVAPTVADFTKWTQTMAGMEVLHAAFGVVRAPLATTVIQVASRYLLVWGVVEQFPYLGGSPVYTSMLLAWSITEVIRYSYFALSLSNVQPKSLTWLRYNMFFVLYPVGISSEAWLIYQAVDPAVAKFGDWYSYILVFILGVYVPGSYVMYTHMMAQRRKIMRGNKEKAK
ncbi:PTPLA-domain-containing protein [Zalerion maritima]|uniref:Very-long-chain (3R)-3-hydroxyacyl-CoA dehydratase n=1 Tax=Zalerion maritima TaxID=339359 RepID=A0AAD5RI24_9PEZI|nr:PTPLA-domain-containing protein [Zalerion maritima]